MFPSIPGIYRDGNVELLETPPAEQTTRVIVTFLPTSEVIDLAARGMAPEQAADLRWRLQAFAEDWDRPEMDVYDDGPTR